MKGRKRTRKEGGRVHTLGKRGLKRGRRRHLERIGNPSYGG